MESFKILGKEPDMEPVVPFDRFGLDTFSDTVGHSLDPDIVVVDSHAYDYTSQLEFHQQEVAEAPKRGMPQAQVDYHLGKIAVLETAPRPPGPPPKFEQHQLDCKEATEGSCSCGK